MTDTNYQKRPEAGSMIIAPGKDASIREPFYKRPPSALPDRLRDGSYFDSLAPMRRIKAAELCIT